MPTPDDFDPYKVVKDATEKTRNFFTSFGGILNKKAADAPSDALKPGQAGRPDRLWKASPAEMKAQDDKRAAATKVAVKRSTTKASPKR